MFKKFCKVKRGLDNENNRLLLLVHTSTGPGVDIICYFKKIPKSLQFKFIYQDILVWFDCYGID